MSEKCGTFANILYLKKIIQNGMENVKGFLTVRQAARIAGVDSFTIYRWLWSGKLKALRKKRKEGRQGRWIIPNHALENLGKKDGD
jgi:transposase